MRRQAWAHGQQRVDRGTGLCKMSGHDRGVFLKASFSAALALIMTIDMNHIDMTK